MKVLLVGGGGREHALAWRIKHDAPGVEIIAAPGNPGIAALARCVRVAATDIDGLLALARAESAALTIVGPEAPLAAGIVDRFRAEGLAIFGPTAGAAQIETSKAFSKGLMERAGVPTARAVICTALDEALEAIEHFGAPVVIKASGLAAGKGVIVCQDLEEARVAARAIMGAGIFGDAGSTVLVEEFMEGEELSVFVVTDGKRAIPLIPAQDHKRLLDGDQGPNTGGMGAYAPVSIETTAGEPLIAEVMGRIIDPVLTCLEESGNPFTGLLYAGLMLTRSGPKVIEFNCRFGDPETQAILPILDASPSLFDLMRAVGYGESLPSHAVVRATGAAVTTVIAAPGYPDAPRIGDPIELPPPADDVIIFHAGTAVGPHGSLVSAGGRVLAVTGWAPDVEQAAIRSRDVAAQVRFAGAQFRRDIGWRELARTRLS
ncbi:MAG TPA: phosphoribosylamine--glycine ligase [Gemmatimonadaceae bacterium]|nr:phosphoribosylamine--glycine ligase [Gemmatimonadaceae bacterium]